MLYLRDQSFGQRSDPLKSGGFSALSRQYSDQMFSSVGCVWLLDVFHLFSAGIRQRRYDWLRRI